MQRQTDIKPTPMHARQVLCKHTNAQPLFKRPENAITAFVIVYDKRGQCAGLMCLAFYLAGYIGHQKFGFFRYAL